LAVEEIKNAGARCPASGARPDARPELPKALHRLALTAIFALGFRSVAVNLRRPDGNYVVVSDMGLEGDLLGSVTSAELWMDLLRDEYRVSNSYLIPPEHARKVTLAHADTVWSVPDMPPAAGPDCWDPDHMLVVPLVNHAGETTGFLSVDCPVDGKLPSRERIGHLETFAQHAALAVENAALLDQLSLRVEHLGALLHISRDISSSLDPASTFDSIVRTTRSLLGADISSLYLVNDQGTHIELKATSGLSSTRLGDYTKRVGEGIVGAVVRDGHPIEVPAVEEDRRVLLSATRREGIRSLLYVPVSVQGSTVGALGVLYRRDNAVPPGAVELLAPIAAHAAVAIRNAKLYNDTKQHAEALLQSEERYKLVSRATNDAVWDWDLATDRLVWNGAIETLFGYAPDRVEPHIDWWTERIHPDDRDEVSASIHGAIEQGTEVWSAEYRFRAADNTYAAVIDRGYIARASDGAPVRMIGSMMDISERKRLEEQLAHQAFHDALTGLPNRALFMNRLEQALARAKRHPSPSALLYLDLDRFKVVNDSLGHEVGDQLLIAVGERLRACVRPQDTVARLGGDEFTILIEDVEDVEQARRCARRVLEVLSTPFTASGHRVFTTASIGIALVVEGERPSMLLRHVDVAMYLAKSKGKARYEVYDPDMNARAVRRLEMENSLRRALERDEFRVHYQPKVDLSTGRVVGMEALLRWEHPQRGMVSPSEFVPIAEDTGLILPLGRWVLEQACRQARVWQEQIPTGGPRSVSVNLSARQFQDPDLAEEIGRMLGEFGLDPHYLQLEITESVMMEHAETAVSTLRRLRGLGVELALDDFGTGYSSLGYLERFDVDTVKIDGSFVRDLGRARGKTAIVEAVITLSRALGIAVVAEGIETAGQLSTLRALGCERGQGYLFSGPVPPDAARLLLLAEKLPDYPSLESPDHTVLRS
jgi:diguanylate cyclase (GGDEF)-like protein/PAS domain S-box-containing protein